MKINKELFKRTASLLLAAFLGVFMMTSCNKSDEDNKEDNDTTISEEPDRKLVLSIGEKSEGTGFDLSISKVFTTTEIQNGNNTITPLPGNVYVFANIELTNKTDETIYFECLDSIIPSVDNQIIDLKEWTAVFPNILNGIENIIDNKQLAVFPDQSSTGYIAFEAPQNFKYCDFTYINYDKTINIFEYTSNNTDLSKTKSDYIASAENDEIAMLVKDIHRVDNPDNQTDYEEASFFIQATIAIQNKTDLIRESYSFGFKSEFQGSEIDPINDSDKVIKSPPQKLAVYKIVFGYPDIVDKYVLKYIDPITDTPLSVEINVGNI